MDAVIPWVASNDLILLVYDNVHYLAELTVFRAIAANLKDFCEAIRREFGYQRVVVTDVEVTIPVNSKRVWGSNLWCDAPQVITVDVKALNFLIAPIVDD